MPFATAKTESARIQLLVKRDGLQAARKWIERTRDIYLEELHHPASHAAACPYRPRFERAVREFEEWLAMPLQ